MVGISKPSEKTGRPTDACGLHNLEISGSKPETTKVLRSSSTLRHTVRVAEKSGCITARIAENRRNSAGLARKQHRQTRCLLCHLAGWEIQSQVVFISGR